MNDDFLKVAKQAALEAGKIIQKYRGKKLQKSVKYEDSSNFATIVDIKAEKTIISILKKAFPTHNFIGEENEKTNNGSEYTWVIDPLDGTFSFGQNIPYFTVSIGLLKNNMPILGVINHIGFNNLYWAEIGREAYLNGKKISVSRKLKLEEAASTLEPGHRQKRQAKVNLYISKLITKVAYPYVFGSAAVTLALVADGSLDLYVTEAYPWDLVAGAVIIREAGGKITDFKGQEPNWVSERLNVIASNGLLHDQILEALRE